MISRVILIGAVVAMVGCSDADIDRGTCGNGLVELGEDCDSKDERCSACGITCAQTADCLAYDTAGGTAGFVCGADLLCHAPSGTFIAGAELPLPVRSFRVTDVNLDGTGDVLAQLQTSVTVLFGDATASATTSASIQTPFAQGTADYADLDGDTSLDMILPTADGVVAYTAPFGVPSPFPFPSAISSAEGRPLVVQLAFSIAHLGIVGVDTGTVDLSYSMLDVVATPPRLMTKLSLCGGKESDLRSTSDIHILNLFEGHQVVAVTLHPPSGPRLCVLAVDIAPGPTYTITNISPAGITPSSRPLLADVRGSTCPSLFVATGGSIIELVGAGFPRPVGPGCGFSGVQPTSAPGGTSPIGAVVLAPQVAGTSPLAIALTTGIYTYAPGTGELGELFRSDRGLISVEGADLDRDGDIDIVASAKGQDSLDLLYRRGTTSTDGFVPLRFATTAVVTKFLLGDFDGDEKPDVAFVERGPLDERLLIAYGTADGLLPGVTVGSFSRILSLITGNLPDSTDTQNIITDLAVLYDDAAPQLALLHGSPQRTMLAFFDPRPQPANPGSVFRGVVAGTFSEGSGGNDVLAIEDAAPASAGESVDPTNIWLSTGATGGELSIDRPPSRVGSVIGRCTEQAASNAVFCIEGAHYLAWPSEDRTHDIVLGFDSKLEMVRFDPTLLPPDMPAAIERFAMPLVATERSAIHALRKLTAPDGSPRMIVSLGPPAGTGARDVGGVNLCTVDALGPSCVELGAQLAAHLPGERTCVDAAPAVVAAASRFGAPPDPAPDLLVLCHEAGGPDVLYRLALDLSRAAPILVVGAADALQIGDVTGDAIDDLVVVDSSRAVARLRLFRQCTSRDVTGCTGAQ